MLYYTIFLLFRFWLIQFVAVTMLDKKQEKWRGTEEQRRTEKKSFALDYFLINFVDFEHFFAFSQLKGNKTNHHKWLWDCNRMCLKIDKILILYFICTFYFSFYFLMFLFFIFFILLWFICNWLWFFTEYFCFHNPFFSFFLEYIFYFASINVYFFFFEVILELCCESEAGLVCV